jgi:hypothetical protein
MIGSDQNDVLVVRSFAPGFFRSARTIRAHLDGRFNSEGASEPLELLEGALAFGVQGFREMVHARRVGMLTGPILDVQQYGTKRDATEGAGGARLTVGTVRQFRHCDSFGKQQLPCERVQLGMKCLQETGHRRGSEDLDHFG